MEKPQSRTCEICNIEINRASFAKHLGSQKHEESQMIIPSKFFDETPAKVKVKKEITIPSLKQLSREKINLSSCVQRNKTKINVSLQ